MSVHPSFLLDELDSLRVAFDMSGDAAYTPDTTMHFPESYSGCADFTTCNGGADIDWFVHAVTHSWQAVNGVNRLGPFSVVTY